MAGSRAPVSNASNSPPSDALALSIPSLHELVTVLGSQAETVDGPQALDLSQGLFRERRPSFQSMQCHPLQEISERNVQVFGKALKHLHKSFFHPRADLRSPDPFGLSCLR